MRLKQLISELKKRGYIFVDKNDHYKTYTNKGHYITIPTSDIDIKRDVARSLVLRSTNKSLDFKAEINQAVSVGYTGHLKELSVLVHSQDPSLLKEHLRKATFLHLRHSRVNPPLFDSQLSFKINCSFQDFFKIFPELKLLAASKRSELSESFCKRVSCGVAEESPKSTQGLNDSIKGLIEDLSDFVIA